MAGATAVTIAVTFVWLGMVLAISFLEAPLKFGAPGVTLAIGLGIGRRVFRALNAVEAFWVVVLAVAVAIEPPQTGAVVALAVAAAALAVQLVAVRPILTRRSDAVLAGADVPRSRAHVAYVGCEVVKVLALLAGGVVLLF